jgi:acetyl-CoA C-acetyltransferase
MSYIKGVGMTRFAVHSSTSQELCYEAVTDALEDANMSISDIDEIIFSKGDSIYDGERQRLFSGVLSSILRDEEIPIIRVTAACSGGGAAFWDAVHSDKRNVLVLGIEKLSSALTKYVTYNFMMAGERVYEQQEGLNFPAQNALIAQQYMMKYGASQKDLALISLKNHENAYHNPKARFYGKKVTLDMIKNSPIVASPLRLFDCSISVDGAAAAIVSKDETDIKIIGSSLYASRLPAFESYDMTTWDAVVLAAKAAYNEAGITHEDVDFAEIHDAFTPVELISYEDLGFCGKGKGSKLIREGATEINGKLPVNTSGGLKAKGHPISPTGLSQIYEVVNQMKGRCGKRQIDVPKYGLTQNIGGVGTMVAIHILRNLG